MVFCILFYKPSRVTPMVQKSPQPFPSLHYRISCLTIYKIFEAFNKHWIFKQTHFCRIQFNQIQICGSSHSIQSFISWRLNSSISLDIHSEPSTCRDSFSVISQIVYIYNSEFQVVQINSLLSHRSCTYHSELQVMKIINFSAESHRCTYIQFRSFRSLRFFLFKILIHTHSE